MKPDDDLSSAPLVRIVCAAIMDKSPGGKIYGGVRHRKLVEAYSYPGFRYWEGFLTNQNTFVSRSTAWNIAEAAGQIVPHLATTPGSLHSEDLY